MRKNGQRRIQARRPARRLLAPAEGSAPPRKNRRSGQELTEYIIVVALVGIGTLFMVSLFGMQIQGVFSGIAGSLAGTNNAIDDTGFQQARLHVKRSGMDNYDGRVGGGDGPAPAQPQGGGGCARGS